MTLAKDEPVAGLFTPVSVERASHVIVDQVRTLIRDGALVPGDRLPSERQLCEEFGVSRVTVREAFRVLEAGGLITIKVGSRGGATVANPTSERLGENLADLLALSRLTAADVTEARTVFELGILPLVVERADDDDVAALHQLVDTADTALNDGVYTVAMSAAFHVRVAECTHNPAVTAIVHSFHGPMLMSLREAKAAAPLMGRQGVWEHRKYVEAIAARDAAAAAEVMTRHLQRTADRVQRRPTPSI